MPFGKSDRPTVVRYHVADEVAQPQSFTGVIACGDCGFGGIAVAFGGVGSDSQPSSGFRSLQSVRDADEAEDLAGLAMLDGPSRTPSSQDAWHGRNQRQPVFGLERAADVLSAHRSRSVPATASPKAVARAGAGARFR